MEFGNGTNGTLHTYTDRIDLCGDAVALAIAAFPPAVVESAHCYSDRVRAAIINPDNATPRLAAAARVWSGHSFCHQNSDGEPVLEDHVTIAKVLYGLCTAAADDDAALTTPAKAAGHIDVDAIVGAGPKYISVREAAKILDVSKDTIQGYIREGRLPAKNIALASKRPTYRLLLDDVIAKRDTVEVARPPSAILASEPPRRRVKRTNCTQVSNGNGSKYKHLNPSRADG